MTQRKVDQSIQDVFGRFDESIEICNSDGRFLGRFLPEDEYRAILYGSVDVPLCEEEILRRQNERGGCRSEEIWKQVGRS